MTIPMRRSNDERKMIYHELRKIGLSIGHAIQLRDWTQNKINMRLDELGFYQRLDLDIGGIYHREKV